jgi:hypothetical protein
VKKIVRGKKIRKQKIREKCTGKKKYGKKNTAKYYEKKVSVKRTGIKSTGEKVRGKKYGKNTGKKMVRSPSILLQCGFVRTHILLINLKFSVEILNLNEKSIN